MNIFEILKSIVMGIVEGITEFLPISSTGHLIITRNLIGFSADNAAFGELFEIVIQLGAILAIVVLYRKKLLHSLKTLAPGGFGFKLWTSLIIAFIPSGIVGLIYSKLKMDSFMMRTLPVALALLVGAFFIIFAEYAFRDSNKIMRIDDVGYKQAVVIGIFQCISIVWPGFSRSAATIIGGWFMGLSTVAAAEFSFFLAIPSMIVASGYSLVKAHASINPTQAVELVVGFVVSFIVALVVVKKFIEYLKTKPMRYFAYYRIAVGVLFLILIFTNVIRNV